jgi:hypothetical protein
LVWNASQLDTFGELSVVLAGDYNFDGNVDAADYVMWRKAESSTAQGYADWFANFGATSAGGGSAAGFASANAVVPEPGSAGLALVGLLALAYRRRTPIYLARD